MIITCADSWLLCICMALHVYLSVATIVLMEHQMWLGWLDYLSLSIMHAVMH